MTNQKLMDSLQFLENIDALKNTYRRCLIMSGERNESTAEHSFSLAMAVLLLQEHSNEKIEPIKTLKMALFHDLAEALLGDTFHYEKQNKTQSLSEEEALKKLLLPIQDQDLATEILQLWQEFEFGGSAEAVFLRGIDRFLPIYHNYKTRGHSWLKFNISKEKVLEKNAHIAQSSEPIWAYTKKILEESKAKGWVH